MCNQYYTTRLIKQMWWERLGSTAVRWRTSGENSASAANAVMSLQIQCGVFIIFLDSRRVLAPAPKGPKHISKHISRDQILRPFWKKGGDVRIWDWRASSPQAGLETTTSQTTKPPNQTTKPNKHKRTWKKVRRGCLIVVREAARLVYFFREWESLQQFAKSQVPWWETQSFVCGDLCWRVWTNYSN